MWSNRANTQLQAPAQFILGLLILENGELSMHQPELVLPLL